jgi:peptidoglycan/LPS O-acetylase OafA/YrhL
VILLRGRLLGLALAGIFAVFVVRLAASGPFEYFSTTTRADAILVGCVMALTRLRWATWIAAVGVAALFAVTLLNTNHDIGITVAMLATAAIIGGRLESLGKLAPIGLRAYSLYLWNWPMTILFGPFGAVAPLLTVLMGEVSFRLLEAPVLHRGPRARRAMGTSAVAPTPTSAVAPMPTSD